MTSPPVARFPPTLSQTIVGAMPLVLGQVYLVWLVVSGRMNFFEVVLMSVIEVVLMVWSGIIFLSPNEAVKSRRLHDQKSLMFMLLFMLYLALTVTTLTLRHDNDTPPGMISEMFLVVVDALTGRAVLYGAIYLAITMGLSAAAARRSDDQMRSWYAHSYFPNSMSFIAMFATVFFGFFPTVMQAEDYPTRLGPWVSVELTALLGLFRIAFGIVMIRKMTPEEFEKMYTKFRAGDDSVEPRQSLHR